MCFPNDFYYSKNQQEINFNDKFQRYYRRYKKWI